MGSMFSSPKYKAPAPPPKPAMPTQAPAAVNEARSRQKRLAAARGGTKGTILTGAFGADDKKKTLLGG